MKLFLTSLKRVLNAFARLTDRVPSRIVFLIGVTSLICSLAIHFDISSEVSTPVTALFSENELLENLLELNVTDNESEALGTEDADSAEAGISSEILAESIAEIPDSLRADPLPVDPMVVSLFTQLGLTETLLPAESSQFFTLGRDAILNDSEGRIAEDFHIPEALRERVGFWFDVYTKYDSNRRIIHHALFPWIIYNVVDVSAIINADSPKHLWMRRMKAERIVKAEVLKVRATLYRLSNRRRFDNLSGAEKEIAAALEPLGQNLRKTSLQALRSVRMQVGQRDFFVEGLQLSSRYLSTMERIFAENRLPTELTRIPFVESSFNRFATSKVGATGVWQIMDSTGRKLMQIDSLVDERRSPLKATEAAARLLRENHMILFRSWPLAVTAWNHGPPGIRLAVQRTGTKDLGKIVGKYRSRSFDFASSNFYCEFLAALHAERYSEEIFGKLDRDSQDTIFAVKLARPMRFRSFVEASGLSATELLAFNPDLTKIARQNLTMPKGFRLHIPEWSIEKLDRLVAVQRPRTSLARKD